MSRITDMSLQPNIVYTKQGFLVRVKVQDDYFYKKYLISENLHYKTIQGTSFTITDVDTTKQASIIEIRGNSSVVTGDNNIVVSNKNLFVATDVFNGYIAGTGALVSNAQNRTVILRAKPNTTYTIQAERKGIVRSDDFILSTDSNYPSVSSTTALRVFTTTDTEIVRTFTTRATDNWIAFKVANVNNSNYEETLATIQLEEGNQATNYTEHKESSYRVDLGGKNKLNPFINHSAGYSTTIRGVTFTINQDGTITANGTATGGSATLILYGSWSGTTVYQTLDKNKDYCLPSFR